MTSEENEAQNLIKALEQFFTIRDPKCERIARELFKLYQFKDIAKGIYLKYGLLPEGWKEQLSALKLDVKAKLDWLKLYNVKWCNKDTVDFPSIKGSHSAMYRSDTYEQVLDELIANETMYFEKLDTFMKIYVPELENATQYGPNAVKFLGLNRSQVDYAFELLRPVVKCTEELLVSLQVLYLVDAPTKYSFGRLDYFLKVMENMGHNGVEAKVTYEKYYSRYMFIRKLLGTQNKKIKKQKLRRGEVIKYLSFEDIWTEISSHDDKLRDLDLGSILSSPIRRFPNYKLFLDRMRKIMPSHEAIYNRVVKCASDMSDNLNSMDIQVEKAENAEAKLFKQISIK